MQRGVPAEHAEALGVESPLLPNVALALGGGIGMQGNVCGAVAGCAMALSLAAAQKTNDYTEQKLAMPAAGTPLSEVRPAMRLGSVADICGLDLTTQEGIAKLMSGVRDEKCAPAVLVAARLLGEELSQMVAS